MQLAESLQHNLPRSAHFKLVFGRLDKNTRRWLVLSVFTVRNYITQEAKMAFNWWRFEFRFNYRGEFAVRYFPVSLSVEPYQFGTVLIKIGGGY